MTAIARSLAQLAEPGVAARMGEAARAYVLAEHDLDRVAGEYVAALEQAAGAPAVEAKIARAVAEAAADTGVEPVAPRPGARESSGSRARTGTSRCQTPGRPSADLRRCGRGSRRSTSSPSSCSSRSRCASSRRGSWSTSSSTPTWRAASPTPGGFRLRGVSANYGFVYPLLISPAYALFGSIIDAYDAARIINALAICSVILPVVPARSPRRPAGSSRSLAAALAVAIPSTIYTGTLMTENAFYPVSVWVAYALVLRPRAADDATSDRPARTLRARVPHARSGGRVRSVRCSPHRSCSRGSSEAGPRRLGAWKPLYGTAAAGALAVLVVADRPWARRPRPFSAATASPRRTRRIRSGPRCAGSPTTWPHSTSRSGSCRSRR